MQNKIHPYKFSTRSSPIEFQMKWTQAAFALVFYHAQDKFNENGQFQSANIVIFLHHTFHHPAFGANYLRDGNPASDDLE
jgi:hypothetical protein